MSQIRSSKHFPYLTYAIASLLMVLFFVATNWISGIETSKAEIGKTFIEMLKEGDEAVLLITDSKLSLDVEEMLEGSGLPKCLALNAVERQVADRENGVQVECKLLVGRSFVDASLLIHVEGGVVVGLYE